MEDKQLPVKQKVVGSIPTIPVEKSLIFFVRRGKGVVKSPVVPTHKTLAKVP